MTTRPHPDRLIDAHAAAFDVSDTYAVVVDAAPAAVLAGLARHDLSHTVADAIELLAPGRRGGLTPARLAAAGAQRVYALAWPVAGGYVRVVWDVRVRDDGEGRTVLSSTIRFVAIGAEARARLLGAWGVVGPLAARLAQRSLGAVKRLAEDEPAQARAVRPAQPPVARRRPASRRRGAGALRVAVGA